MSAYIAGRGTNIIVNADGFSASFPGSQAPMTLGFSSGEVVLARFSPEGFLMLSEQKNDNGTLDILRGKADEADTATIASDPAWVVGGYNYAGVAASA